MIRVGCCWQSTAAIQKETLQFVLYMGASHQSCRYEATLPQSSELNHEILESWEHCHTSSFRYCNCCCIPKIIFLMIRKDHYDVCYKNISKHKMMCFMIQGFYFLVVQLWNQNFKMLYYETYTTSFLILSYHMKYNL